MSGSKPHQVICHSYRWTKKTLAPFFPVFPSTISLRNWFSVSLRHRRCHSIIWDRRSVEYTQSYYIHFLSSPLSGGWGRDKITRNAEWRDFALKRRSHVTMHSWEHTVPTVNAIAQLTYTDPLTVCVCVQKQLHVTKQHTVETTY